MKKALIVQDFFSLGKAGGNLTLGVFPTMKIDCALAPLSFKSCYGLDKFNKPLEFNLSRSFVDLGKMFSLVKREFDCIYLGQFIEEAQGDDVSQLLNYSCSHNTFLVSSLSGFEYFYNNKSKEKSGAICFSQEILNIYKKSNFLICDVNNAFLFIKALGKDITEKNSRENVEIAGKFLREYFSASVIITDFPVSDDKTGVCAFYIQDDGFRWFFHKRLPDNGFGNFCFNDFFSCLCTGFLINNISFYKSLKFSCSLADDLVKTTLSKPDYGVYGTDFEEVLAKINSILQLSDN